MTSCAVHPQTFSTLHRMFRFAFSGERRLQPRSSQAKDREFASSLRLQAILRTLIALGPPRKAYFSCRDAHRLGHYVCCCENVVGPEENREGDTKLTRAT